MIAALFVAPDGPYAGLPDVEVWDVEREARLYAGSYRVIAHPPCERWGRYWGGGPSARVKRLKGDDGGCFVAALEAVRKWGGVLEHPAASSAWDAFGLKKPPRAGGWVLADWRGGWTCCVDQGHYGHRAQKATWLYANGLELPTLRWGKARSGVRLDEGFHSAEERRRKVRTGICQRMSKRESAHAGSVSRSAPVDGPRRNHGAGRMTTDFAKLRQRLQKPERGSSRLEKESRDADADALEKREKAATKKRDGRCRWPEAHKCRGGLEAAHIKDASLGGAMDRRNLVTICAWLHRRGPESIHGKRLRIAVNTKEGADGPLSFYRNRGDYGRYYLVAREIAPFRYEKD